MKIHNLYALGLASLLIAVGCDGPTDADTGTPDDGTDQTASIEPATLDLTSPTDGPVSIKVFDGGYGKDFFEEAAEEYSAEHGVETTVLGDPHLWESLKPEFVAGDVPDFSWPGWGMDYWALVYEDQIEPMNAYLAMPAYGETEGKWRDSFDEELLKLGQYKGEQYMLPFHVNLNGWWYNKTLFEKHGWSPPQTFEELLVLGEDMKAAGIAPLTYQGKWPYYMLYGFIYSWTISAGGIDAWNDCQNLEEGAWSSDAVMQAAQAVVTLRDRGFFLDGSLSLDHIQSETEFLNGKAGMVPCGTWLYSEMRAQWPAGVVAEFMLPPPFEDGKGDKTALMVALEPFIIPSKAKNKDHGVNYYRYITSKSMVLRFVEDKGTLMAVKGSEDAIYPPELVRPAELFEQSTTKWNSEFRWWYKALGVDFERAMSALLGGSIDAEEFCERLEAAAEKTRNDDRVPKHRVG